MHAKPSLLSAIRDLSMGERVPLTPASRLLRSHQLDQESTNIDLLIRLGVPLEVTVRRSDDDVSVRGDLGKMNWSPYEAISIGLSKLIAANLNVDVQTIEINKLLVVDDVHATQFFEIAVPPSESEGFASHNTQADVKTFLEVLRGQPVPTAEIAPIDSREDAALGMQTTSIDCNRQSQAAEFAREVRAAIGGKTLPAACTIDSPSWTAPMHLAGKLGERIPKPRPAPKRLVIECCIDGYIKSSRVVHLLPVLPGSEGLGVKGTGRKVVAFDEKLWLKRIAELAAKHGVVVSVTYLSSVSDGGKELLQLLDLVEVPAKNG